MRLGRCTLTSDVLMYSGKEQVRWWGEIYVERVAVETEFGRRAVEGGFVTGTGGGRGVGGGVEGMESEGDGGLGDDAYVLVGTEVRAA